MFDVAVLYFFDFFESSSKPLKHQKLNGPKSKNKTLKDYNHENVWTFKNYNMRKMSNVCRATNVIQCNKQHNYNVKTYTAGPTVFIYFKKSK